jgi:hypothetical protein
MQNLHKGLLFKGHAVVTARLCVRFGSTPVIYALKQTQCLLVRAGNEIASCQAISA